MVNVKNAKKKKKTNKKVDNECKKVSIAFSDRDFFTTTGNDSAYFTINMALSQVLLNFN
ncbi:hypothetical protein SAMN05421807_114108 [Virgibacillus chiguensis]|uniref:Uncharacterized protein n=1 Tax=Virgibacillus chiguensis TaxID=411959 RepID=A0A1M5W2Y4_9BACI|nr:hypothetical protein SAMN05421807_114108 [Virgibacillus chiguensis]